MEKMDVTASAIATALTHHANRLLVVPPPTPSSSSSSTTETKSEDEIEEEEELKNERAKSTEMSAHVMASSKAWAKRGTASTIVIIYRGITLANYCSLLFTLLFLPSSSPPPPPPLL